MKYLHTMVRVSDLEASLEFYCEHLGLIETSRHESQQGQFTLIYLAAPNDNKKDMNAPLLELTYNWDKEEYSGGRNFGHLAFQVDDIYLLCKTLQTAGITISRPPRDGRMAFVRSPDGISIELLQKGVALKVQEPWQSMPCFGEW